MRLLLKRLGGFGGHCFVIELGGLKRFSCWVGHCLVLWCRLGGGRDLDLARVEDHIWLGGLGLWAV